MERRRLRRNPWIITFLNLPIALWAPFVGLFTFETWSLMAGLLLGACPLVFNGRA